MIISEKLKQRFCKDCNVPIKIFKEPYFSERMKLFDSFYNISSKWDLFLSELLNYKSEQDYFEEYNRVKDAAISSIKSSDGYLAFIEDPNVIYWLPMVPEYSSKDIFRQANDKHYFISLDMKQANYNALKHYDNSIFTVNNIQTNSWEEFISKFTDNRHIQNSKYIRQVILGNCCASRQVRYERQLIEKVLKKLLIEYVEPEWIVSVSNDEIVIDVTSFDDEFMIQMYEKIQSDIYKERFEVPLKVELFKLNRNINSLGYIKSKISIGYPYEFKCIDAEMLPFVIRYFNREKITENDKVFVSNHGVLAKFIEPPVKGVMQLWE